MINSLVSDPRFLLFLRNTSKLKFKSENNKLLTVEIKKSKNDKFNEHIRKGKTIQRYAPAKGKKGLTAMPGAMGKLQS